MKPMAARRTRQMLEAGERAPDFMLRGLDGADHSLASLLAEGPALLAFLKVSCPVCQYTFPFLERLHRNGRGVRFVAVSQDGARDTSEFLDEFGVSFPALLDEERRLYPASNGFRISHVPSMFLVEPDGAVSWASTGFSKPELEELGERVGAATFTAADRVPEWKAG
jgi:peroxiredoxin